MVTEKIKRNDIEKVLEGILEPGVVIYSVRVSHKEPSREIEILIDRPGGLNLEQCANIHREFSRKTNDSLFDTYQVTFGTPGLDRNCIYPQDFQFHIDKEFVFRLKDDLEIAGRVEIIEGDTELLRVFSKDSEPIMIQWKDVSIARFKIAAQETKK